ncbi:hypothetical protein FOZ61_000445 [Perkinsus olseni]|nr:hypothetical protein FOZ61_000445 [Perkinsus olseni]
MSSAGKNAPRHDLRAVRAIANTTVPNVLLPSGVFRCKQYIAFQERDMGNRLHQPVKIDWIWPKNVTPDRDQSSHVLKECPTPEELQHNTVILYVHGGGFCMCSSGTHRHLLYTLALKTERCILCCVNYRQPPEISLLESTSDVECMYRYLISNMGVSPERIAIAGDSAGGDMAVLALVQLRNKKIPLPGCACLISPWVDLADKVDYFDQTPQQTPRELPGSESITSSSRRGSNRRRKSSYDQGAYTCVDYLPADLVVDFAQLAIGDISADDPRVSAMYADLRGLPDMLIHAGQAELLLPQIERFAAKFSAQKSDRVELEYREFEDMVHVFQLFSFCCGPDEAPNRSLSDIADFEGCGSVTLAERAWSPRDIEDVKIMLSDRVQYVGCASRGHFYACKFDGNCVTPSRTSNLRGRSTLPTTTTNSTTAVLPTSGGWTDKDGPIAMMDEISEDIEMDTVDSMESHNFYCETPELATAAHAFCSSIRRGSWCQLDQTPPTCFDESHLCGCFGDRDVPRDFYNPTGNCSVLESHYFCQAETRNGRCNFGAGPPYLCEDSDTNCACDRL